MKTYRIFLIPMLLTALMVGCSKDNAYFNGGTDKPDPTPTPTEDTGYLDLSDFVLGVAEDAEVFPTTGTAGTASLSSVLATRAAGAVTDASDDYLITITNNKTSEVVFDGTYAQLKAATQPMPLAPSSYNISAKSANFDTMPAVDWETPVFSGSKPFTIIKNTTTSLTESADGDNRLVCTLGNIKATASVSASLDKLFKPDDAENQLKITLSMGDASLDYGRTETRAAYFKPQAETNKMQVRLRGLYNKAAADETPVYTAVDWKQEISNCKAGQWRNITITILNSDKGNIQFQLTVETWVYDEKIDVDITSYYAAIEEEIPDEEVSDENSPVVTLDNGDINSVFTLNSSMFDFDVNTCSKMLTAVVTPTTGSTVEKLNVVFDSDNAEFLAAIAAAGYTDNTIALWPSDAESNLKSSVVMKESGSALMAKATYAGMKGIYDYTGTHTLKYVAVDSQNRTSYTTLTISVTHSAGETGPSIEWRGHDFDVVYSQDKLEVVIDINSATGITGFLVDIDSPEVLPEDELLGMSLAAHMDLINPTDEKMSTMLKTLEFPVGDDVKGKKYLKFDITSFMPMISALNREGQCNFKLTVTDDSGTTERTIQLNVVKVAQAE